MPIRNVLASVAVKDLESAVQWYGKLLNSEPSRPMAEVAEWHFEGGRMATGLRVAGARWFGIVHLDREQHGRARKSSFQAEYCSGRQIGQRQG